MSIATPATSSSQDVGIYRFVLLPSHRAAPSLKKLSGAAEARKNLPTTSLSQELSLTHLTGRAHNPEGNGSKPFSATFLFAFLLLTCSTDDHTTC
jgi:hypothetical protein